MLQSNFYPRWAYKTEVEIHWQLEINGRIPDMLDVGIANDFPSANLAQGAYRTMFEGKYSFKTVRVMKNHEFDFTII